jgi:hypothetical protein
LKDLVDFVKKLGDSSKYTVPSCGLGPLTIKQMVMNHMRERRRQNQMSECYIASGETTTETEIDSESQSEASASDSSPPSCKKDQYAQYFHPSKYEQFFFLLPFYRSPEGIKMLIYFDKICKVVCFLFINCIQI